MRKISILNQAMKLISIRRFVYGKSNLSRSTFYVLIVCFLLGQISLHSVQAQPLDIDSLMTLLADEQDDAKSADLQLLLANRLKDENPSEAVNHGNEALEYFIKENHPDISKTAITLAVAYSNMGDVAKRDQYLELTIGRIQNAHEQAQVYALMGRSHFGTDSMFIYYDKYFQTCIENNLVEEMPNAYSQLGVMSAMRGNYPSADSLWRLGLSVTLDEKYNLSRQGLLYNLCILNMQNAQYEDVFDFAKEGYELTKTSKNLNTELGFLNMLSKVSAHNLDTQEAHRYLLEGYETIKNFNLNSTVASDVVYSIARQHLGFDSLDQAIENSQHLVDMSEVNGRLDDRANGYGIMALAAMKGNVQDQAISNIRRSLIDTAKLRAHPLLNGIFQNAAVIFHHYDRSRSALVVLDQIGQNLKLNYNLDADKSAEELKYKVYKQLGRTNDALVSLERFKLLSDQQKDLSTTNKLMESKVKFDADRKQYQLDKSEAEVKLLAAKNDARKKQMIIGGFALLSIFGLLFLYKSWKDARRTAALQASFSQGLIRTQEEERKRVARELHDGVGQKLMLLSKQSSSAGHETMSTLASESLDEIRSISRGLHPSNLETLGCSQAIRSMIDEIDQQSNIFFTHEIENIDHQLHDETALHLYRIIQESINNIVKHANAKAALISLSSSGQEIHAVIEDNGIGFDTQEGNIIATSLGMKTLKERCEIINGKINIDSRLGEGTKIVLQIPIKIK